MGMGDPDMLLNYDIKMRGHVLYRYKLDQVEIEGQWNMVGDENSEKFAYVVLKNSMDVTCEIPYEDIQNSPPELQGRNFTLHVCSANLHESILIAHPDVLSAVLEFLSTEYTGYFIYFYKTIEDRFNLNFELDNGQIKISGEGSNNLGTFGLAGFVNFYMNKGRELNRRADRQE